MLIGAWRNFDHIEEELSFIELVEIVKALREKEHRKNKMAAALKGINLDEGKSQEDDPVEASKKRAALRRAQEAGLSEEEFNAKEAETRLQQVGFAVIKK